MAEVPGTKGDPGGNQADLPLAGTDHPDKASPPSVAADKISFNPRKGRFMVRRLSRRARSK